MSASIICNPSLTGLDLELASGIGLVFRFGTSVPLKDILDLDTDLGTEESGLDNVLGIEDIDWSGIELSILQLSIHFSTQVSPFSFWVIADITSISSSAISNSIFGFSFFFDFIDELFICFRSLVSNSTSLSNMVWSASTPSVIAGSDSNSEFFGIITDVTI